MRINVDTVAMDYDRTIADESKGFIISDEVKQELMRFGHFKRVLATGRRFEDIPDRDVLKVFDVIVSENGTIMNSDGGKRKEVLVKSDGWTRTRSEITGIMNRSGMRVYTGEVVLAGYKDDAPELANEIMAAGLNEEVELEFNKEGLLIMPKGWNKGRGVREVMRRMGCTRLLGIGDDLNDLSLLRVAEIGVAVKNAVPELKMIADIICEKENGYGVIEVLRLIEGYNE
ncbi:MAG TPA: HAD hydrolase family protein [Candidatus Methanomethylicus sp.]|nr:HAD hydrolase family protein [Candidatus Methanomethylicus sp.]HRU81578.1 HAD hydrolase family protein [Candidatus Methanomethylicus sp.]